jgi:hypothetical protein
MCCTYRCNGLISQRTAVLHVDLVQQDVMLGDRGRHRHRRGDQPEADYTRPGGRYPITSHD